MPRKTRSDSITQKRLDAARPDTSILPTPSIPGDSALGKIGHEFLATLYRSDPERFSVGDLALLLETAHCFEQLTESRHLSKLTPQLIRHPNGVLSRHPHFIVHADLSRQFQTLLRDAGLRSKDGARGALQTVKAEANATTDDADNVTSFDSWLASQ